MKRTNVTDPEIAPDDREPEGYRTGMLRPGPEFGATRTGVSVYELPPGQSICPYHFECGEEEWLLVIVGAPQVRHPGGVTDLVPGDLVFFPTGPGGAHKVTNTTDEPVRVVMFSDIVTPSVTVYPDSGKVGVWPGAAAERLIVRRADGVDYWDGEVVSGA